jgi:hypothetical protein
MTVPRGDADEQACPAGRVDEPDAVGGFLAKNGLDLSNFHN